MKEFFLHLSQVFIKKTTDSKMQISITLGQAKKAFQLL